MNNNLQQTAENLKSILSKLMSEMTAFQAKYKKAELPMPSSSFELSKELLERGEFNLAVCGKVKNGKSSLINALIGRELLPVCTDVATSRVFKITNSDKDKFYLVYANGNREEISESELAIYGSQAEIDKHGEVEIEQTIAYIQIYTKLDFLPENVSLIDTPGIGSTYPQHTAITKRFIRMADAALFVINPTPLEKIELDFLKEIIDVTPGVVFVTTKIDQNNINVVEESIKRNADLIEKAVGERLIFGINIQKMSSKLLLNAAADNNELTSQFNLEISGYQEVKEAIQSIVFLTLGYYRSGLAYNESLDYYSMVLETLKIRKDKILEAKLHYDSLLASYDKAYHDFSSRMGDAKKSEIRSQVEVILRTMESDFNLIFSPKGKIAEKYFEEIDNLSSDDIKLYGEDLGSRVVSDVQASWDSLTKLVQQKIAAILMQYSDDCRMAIPKGLIPLPENTVANPNIQDVQLRDRIGKMRNEMFLGTALTGAATTVVGAAYYFMPALVTPALPVLAPVLVVLGLGAVLWGAISGNSKAKLERLQKNKSQLQKYIQDTIANCRKQLVETSLADNKYHSLYQGFVNAVREQVKTSMDVTYDNIKSELTSMKKTVKDSRQDPSLVSGIEYLIKTWEGYKTTLQDVEKILSAIKPF
jgi:GTPase SAR1 family protein